MLEILAQSLDWHQWPSIAADWERIHNLSPDASFFLSKDWVDCWLATFGEKLNPELLTFVQGGELVGCCILVFRTQWVRGIPLRRVYLNCDGENDPDSTCIECNSLLCYPDCEKEVAQALVAYLKNRNWDEFVLRGVVEHAAICAVAAALGRTETSVRPSHYVDLRRVRCDAAGFDSVLSSNTRQQIRRSQRLYAQTIGPCSIRVAGTSEEAKAIFTRLAGLHQAAWRDRGQPGVFASPEFTAFHRRLIETGLQCNRILLIEALAGAETIGALYSFLHRRRVSFYQSGFRYSIDGRLKPGVLTHYLAIRHFAEQQDVEEYDFLAGDSQYKRSLATDMRPLLWMVVRRATAATLLMGGLRRAKHASVQMFVAAKAKLINSPSFNRACDDSNACATTGAEFAPPFSPPAPL